MTSTGPEGLRLLVVGLGRQGTRQARVAGQLGLDIVGTVDPFSDGLAGIPHHRTVAEAIAAVRPEAAIVAVPTRQHRDAVEPLLAAGIPAMVEKPLAADPGTAAEIVELSERFGVLLATGHVERFNPSVQLVRDMLHSGKVGAPIACSFRRVGLPPPTRPDVDVVLDLAVHDVDVFSVLTGGVPELVGAAGWGTEPDHLESAHLLVTSGSVHGQIEVNWRTPVRLRSFVVTTDECLVDVNYTSQTIEVIEASEVRDFDEFAGFRSHYAGSRRTVVQPGVAEPLAEQMKAFVAAVRGADAGPIASGRDGLAAVRIAHEASELAARDRAAGLAGQAR